MSISSSVQKPPASLAGVLNSSDQRDSAYYSAKDPASRHNSTQSTTGFNPMVHATHQDTLSTADLQTSSTSSTPQNQSLHSPTSDAMSVASIVSPSSNGQPLSLYESSSRISGVSISSATSALSKNADPRRGSVDSRLGANFGDMRLANSPYGSANPSTTSLQSTLAQQRNPSSANHERISGPFRSLNGYNPNFHRLPDPPMRTAPLITGPALGAIARASEPTKGQAWAFPEEPVHRIPPSVRSISEASGKTGSFLYDESRRNSLADSIASSQYTTESRLPPGQRRLEDGFSTEHSQRTSAEFHVSTHHHSLQNKQLGELQTEGDSPSNSQPYSRTPELRVSHKLAERKRRLEMKDLFDNLRTLQSVERGAKASKWEILSKAISEHERQTKVIEEQKKVMNDLESKLQAMKTDLDCARREASTVRVENTQLRSELASYHAHSQGQYHNAPSLPRSYNMQTTEQHSQLPPLRSLQCPEIMNGVLYHHEQRQNIYRPSSDRF